MTEEYPEHNKEDYEFPNQQIEELRELEAGSPRYAIVMGSVYEKMRYEISDFDASDAVEVNRLLHDGEVDEAEKTIREMLGEDNV